MKVHGNTGRTAWNKGKKDTPPRSEEVKKKISEGMKGKSTKWLTGRKLSEEAKKKLSISHTGKKRPWVKGHPKGWRHSKETRLKLSGPNNPHWKGGKRKIVLRIRGTFEYRQWRSDIFTRDNFTCLHCGTRGGTLNADHFPKTFASIITENSLDTLEKALECSELWDINNGRTLCIICHRKTDTWGLKHKYERIQCTDRKYS